MPLSSETHYVTASDGLELAYAIDDFSDPWKPREALILIHAAMGSSRRLYKWVPILAREFCVVRPDMRGHGVGRALVRAALTLATKTGARGVVLWTQPTMHAAQLLYQQCGFRRDPGADFSRDRRQFLVYRRSLTRNGQEGEIR